MIRIVAKVYEALNHGNMPVRTAVRVFEALNHGKVKADITRIPFAYSIGIVTDTEPKDLVYPKGWYYAKGTFRNKHTSTTGYHEVYMRMTDDTPWSWRATYCTLD